jgi:hypothetical protein
VVNLKRLNYWTQCVEVMPELAVVPVVPEEELGL